LFDRVIQCLTVLFVCIVVADVVKEGVMVNVLKEHWSFDVVF